MKRRGEPLRGQLYLDSSSSLDCCTPVTCYFTMVKHLRSHAWVDKVQLTRPIHPDRNGPERHGIISWLSSPLRHANRKGKPRIYCAMVTHAARLWFDCAITGRPNLLELIRRDILKLTTGLGVHLRARAQVQQTTIHSHVHIGEGDAAVAYPIQGLPDLRFRAGKCLLCQTLILNYCVDLCQSVEIHWSISIPSLAGQPLTLSPGRPLFFWYNGCSCFRGLIATCCCT
jgi:hypothetical protein